MINFTVGPVQSDECVRRIGAEQVPYFRTPEFSQVMLENERWILQFAKAPKDSRAVFITGSGTASMEAAVMNTLSPSDRVILVNGGSFGARFEELLTLHEIPHDVIRPEPGKKLTAQMLEPLDGKGYTAFVVNIHETSTGVLYDAGLIHEFCQRNGLFLIVDAISSFIADPIDMEALGIDVMITGSQKALACPPGISVIMLSPAAIDRVHRMDPKILYLNLKSALVNGERGQTPFTPAVGTLLQIHARLNEIAEKGGIGRETERIAKLATYFRERIADLPFAFFSESMSNACTALRPLTASAVDLFTALKDEYGIWVCPNGGALRETVFRVGHIGALNEADYDQLITAFRDMRAKGIL